jgi:hypothetical protein
MIGDVVSTGDAHRRVADIAQVALNVIRGGDTREERAGPVGRGDPDRARSTNRLSQPQAPCGLIGSLARAYPLVEYVVVVVVR